MVFIPACSSLAEREELVKAADAILTRREEMLKKAEATLRTKETSLNERERLVEQREAAAQQVGKESKAGREKVGRIYGHLPMTRKVSGAKRKEKKGSFKSASPPPPSLGFARKTIGGRVRGASKHPGSPPPRASSPAKSVALVLRSAGGGRGGGQVKPPSTVEPTETLTRQLRPQRKRQQASSLPGDIMEERLVKKSKRSGRLLSDVEAHLKPKKPKPAWQYWMGENKERVMKDAGGNSRLLFTCAFTAYQKLTDKSKWEREAEADTERYKREVEALGCRVTAPRPKRLAVELAKPTIADDD